MKFENGRAVVSTAGLLLTFSLSVMGALAGGFFAGVWYSDATAADPSETGVWAEIKRVEDKRYDSEVENMPKHGEEIVIDGHHAGFMPLDPDEIEQPVKLDITAATPRDATDAEISYFNSLMSGEGLSPAIRRRSGEVATSIRYISAIDGPIRGVSTYAVVTDYRILQTDGVTYHVPQFSVLIGKTDQLKTATIVSTKMLIEYATEHSVFVKPR